MTWRKGFGILRLCAVLVAVIVLAGHIIIARQPKPFADRVLKQIGAALRAYSQSQPDGRFPPKAAEWDVFLPDMDALEPFIAQQPDADLIRAYLRGECGVQVCYTGYLAHNVRMGMALLDEFEARNPAIPEADLPIPGEGLIFDYGHYGDAFRIDRIPRLREGAERYIMTEINGPGPSLRVESEIPLLWEMPDTTDAAPGWVLYMDGHTERHRYPEAFPLTQPFIVNLRELMGPYAPPSNSRTPQCQAPFLLRRRVPPSDARLPEELLACRPLAIIDITHCDQKPTVKLDGFRGFRVQTPEGEFVLFPEDASVSPGAKKAIWHDPPKAPRLILPRDVDRLEPGCESDVPLPTYMGRGYGFHWFAHTSIRQLERFQSEFEIEEGEKPAALLEEAKPVFQAIRKQGIADLTRILRKERDPDHVAEAVLALDAIGGPEARAAVAHAFSADNRRAPANAKALIELPEPLPRSSGVSRRASEESIRLAVDVLMRTESQETLAQMAADYIMRRRRSRTGFPGGRGAGMEMLRRLPRKTYAMPLNELSYGPTGQTRPWAEAECMAWQHVLDELPSGG